MRGNAFAQKGTGWPAASSLEENSNVGGVSLSSSSDLFWFPYWSNIIVVILTVIAKHNFHRAG